MQTGKHAANVGSRLKLAWKPGRRHLKSQPSSRIGENPPYGMIGGIEETSASFEARSAPRSYPSNPRRPRSVRRRPRGRRRSVGRGAYRPAPRLRGGRLLSREIVINPGADVVHLTEGKIGGRVIASGRRTWRGLRPW